jgi:uncharacterized protein (DUF1778 family)
MSDPKEERLNIRLTPDEKAAITEAANLSKSTVSAFVLQHAYPAAQEVLMSQREFKLSDNNWEAFCAALDSPPRDIPRLRSLLTQPSPLDAQKAMLLSAQLLGGYSLHNDGICIYQLSPSTPIPTGNYSGIGWWNGVSASVISASPLMAKQFA